MLIEVLTRCYKRPHMLRINQASVDAQTNPDWQQTLLADEVGRGIGWSHRRLAAYAPHLEGDYIWVLDDDDECVRPTLFAEIRRLVATHDPDLILVRMDHGPLGILPSDEYWGKPPFEGQIGTSAAFVRRGLWQQCADSWSDRYAGDFDFLAAVFAQTTRVFWHDVIASRVQRISRGMPE